MIFDLVINGDLQGISDWLDAGNDINTINSDQNSLLGFAILSQQWQVAELLLTFGASTNCVINNDPEHRNNVCLIRRPMQHNRWDLVEKLIRSGADARDCWNHLSPLGYFVKANNMEMIHLILDRFPDLADYPETHSPLKLAIIAGHLDIVKVLVKAGASLIKKQSLNGNGISVAFMATPIQFARHFNRNDIVDYLIEINSELSNDLDQPYNLDLSALDPEDQRSALMTRLFQGQDESDALRSERAQRFFDDLEGLSSAISEQVLPALAIINNGRVGTAFYQCPTWIVTNAHVAPSRDDLQDWRLSSWNNDVTTPAIKRSFHRQERSDMPDLVIIEVEDNSGISHPTLMTRFTENKAWDEILTFYVDHDLKIKFLKKVSDENSYPLIYECLDGSSPQPGASGSPILQARVVIARKLFWQFRVVGALYARCSPEEQRCSISRLFCGLFSSTSSESAMRVCAIPVIQDFDQLLDPLNALNETERYHESAKTSATFSDEQGQEDERRYSTLTDITLQFANEGFLEYQQGQPPLSIDLPLGLEKLLGKGIVALSESVLLGEKVVKRWEKKGFIKQIDRLPHERIGFPYIELSELNKDFEALLNTINDISEIQIQPSDANKTIFTNDHFRIDQLGASGEQWRLEIQDNTDKFYKRTSPSLSCTFAIVLLPKNLEKLQGSVLREAFNKSQADKEPKEYEKILSLLCAQRKSTIGTSSGASTSRSTLFGKTTETDPDKKFAALLLERFDLVVKQLPKDGHCQFRAVAEEIGRLNNLSEDVIAQRTITLRKNTVKYMRSTEGRAIMEQFFNHTECNNQSDYETYLTHMDSANDANVDTNAYGSHITLVALGNILWKNQNKTIILLHPADFVEGAEVTIQSRVFGCNDLGNLDLDNALYLVYDGGNHYDSIWELSEDLKNYLKSRCVAATLSIPLPHSN